MQARIRDGKPVDFWDNRPDVHPEYVGAYRMFEDCRRRTCGGEPVSSAEILAWLDVHRVDDPHERAWFYRLACYADDAFLSEARLDADASADD